MWGGVVGGSSRILFGGCDGWEKVCVSIGSNVEDGVDVVGEESKRVLGGDELDKGYN